MSATNSNILIDCFLKLNISETDKANWSERIEAHRKGFDGESFLKQSIHIIGKSDSNMETIKLFLQSPNLSDNEHIALFKDCYCIKNNIVADEFEQIIKTKDPIQLENLAVYINDYEKIFGDYYFEKVYMKDSPNVAGSFGKTLQQIGTYDELVEAIINEKIKVYAEEGRYKDKGKYERKQAERNDRSQEKSILKKSFDRSLKFMNKGLGLTEIERPDDIIKLKDNEIVLGILQILMHLREKENDILSSLEKSALDKKECALGRGSARSLDAQFNYIRRNLMKNLSSAELKSLTLIAACFDYNRIYLQEAIKDLIDDIARKIEQQYTSEFLSTDTRADNEQLMHERYYQINHILFPCFHAECVKVLKNEIKQLTEKICGNEKGKRSYRHIAYLHSIGICGFSYSDEYDVYQGYFEEQSPNWKIKNWITDEQRKKIRNIPRKFWEFQWDEESLDLLLAENGGMLPHINIPGITDCIKSLQIEKYKHKIHAIDETGVLSLPEEIKEYLADIFEGTTILEKINERPDVYLVLAFLANYVVFSNPCKSFKTTMLALCVLCHKKFIQEQLNLLEPHYRVTEKDARKSKKITGFLRSHGIITTASTFYLTTIGYIVALVIDEFCQDTRYAEEYMDWLEIKRDLSNLLINKTIIQNCTLEGIIEERSRIFEKFKDNLTVKANTILNQVRNRNKCIKNN